MDEAQIRTDTRQFILDEFLPGTPAEELTDDMGLMSGGVLNSLATTRLVGFLEEKYGIQVEAHEMGADHMDSVDLIVALVKGKG